MADSKLIQMTSVTEKFRKFWLRDEGSENKKEFHAEKLQFDDVNFIMCAIFCAIAIATLIIFSITALVRRDISFAFTLFGFALATTIGIGTIWITGVDWLAKHFTTLIMAILCIYLFYTGGTSGTGPIIFLVFPSVALFLQGNYIGAYSVVGLLILSSFIYAFNLLGFDNSQYEDALITRVFMVYVLISALSYAFSYFKDKAEKDFLTSQQELEQGNIKDSETGLANRALLEKLLQLESGRCKQYQRPGSFITIKLAIELTKEYKYLRNNNRLVYKNIRKIFNKVLRHADIPGHWTEDQLLILLPETNLKTAHELSEKLSTVFKNYNTLFDDPTVDVKATITAEEIAVPE